MKIQPSSYYSNFVGDDGSATAEDIYNLSLHAQVLYLQFVWYDGAMHQSAQQLITNGDWVRPYVIRRDNWVGDFVWQGYMYKTIVNALYSWRGSIIKKFATAQVMVIEFVNLDSGAAAKSYVRDLRVKS